MPAERALSNGFGSFQVEASASSRGRPTCEPCRQRKVRCNRKLPCSTCSRFQLSCVYAKRSRRGPIRPPSRISQSPSPETPSPSAAHVSAGRLASEPSNTHVLHRLENVETLLKNLIASLGSQGLPKIQSEGSQIAPRPVSTLQRASSHEMLVGGGERGSYIDDSVFVGILLDDSARRGATKTPPVSSSLPAHYPAQALGIITTDIFGPETDDLFIPSQTLTTLWALYIQNVDPLTKLLHIPTVQSVILHAGANLRGNDDTTWALSYAVCFAAVASVLKNDAVQLLGFEKLTLLRHFMCQLDSALMKVRILIYPNFQALQALVIYLTALRTHDTGRSIWILVGIAIRLAESLGVHQYGINLGLSPFETEMRCRLWWHLTALDSSAREGNGFNSTIINKDQTFRLPLNVDDVHLHPQMTELPTTQDHWTEMTFPIANLEICRGLTQAAATRKTKEAGENEKAIHNVEQMIQQRYLQLADPARPICRAVDALVRISVAKAQFVLALQSWLSRPKTSPETAPRYHQLPQPVFTSAVELLENGYFLQSGKFIKEYAWFYKQHPHLYAFFLVLHVLKDSPERAEADRAWVAVDDYFTCLSDFVEAGEKKQRKSCFWSILGPLCEKAREARRRVAQRVTEAAVEQSSMALDDVLETATGDSTEFAAMDMQPGNPLALGTLDFDNILALQDFSDWFDSDQLPS